MDRHHLSGDQQSPVRADAWNRAQELHGRDLLAHFFDACIELTDHGPEVIDEGEVCLEEPLLLRSHVGRRFARDLATSLLGQKATPGQAKADGVKLAWMRPAAAVRVRTSRVR